MPSDKLGLEITTEAINTGYEPSYIPLFPILTKTVKYVETIGEVKLKETKIIGDATARKISAQDTEWKHAKVGPASKQFNKYFAGIKYIASGLQDNADAQRIANELLDINLMEFDKNFFFGDPTDDGTLRNNGLFASADANYITNSSTSLSSTPDVGTYKDLFDALLAQAEAKVGNAAKIILLSGTVTSKLGRFVPNTATSFARALAASYADSGKQVSFASVPTNITVGASANGILVLTPSKLIHRYTAFPYIKQQGYNAENDYTWMNLMLGSSMVDVEKEGALIKQPVTFS